MRSPKLYLLIFCLFRLAGATVCIGNAPVESAQPNIEFVAYELPKPGKAAATVQLHSSDWKYEQFVSIGDTVRLGGTAFLIKDLIPGEVVINGEKVDVSELVLQANGKEIFLTIRSTIRGQGGSPPKR